MTPPFADYIGVRGRERFAGHGQLRSALSVVGVQALAPKREVHGLGAEVLSVTPKTKGPDRRRSQLSTENPQSFASRIAQPCHACYEPAAGFRAGREAS